MSDAAVVPLVPFQSSGATVSSERASERGEDEGGRLKVGGGLSSVSELGVVEVSDLSLLCRDSSKRPVCGCESYLSALV